ncbi:putative immunity protein [Streptomyces sp. NPDC090022]|uniref:putative immunity protein n=1 Tax=Streptomyces sp. NPDC090022 TaxID=3365920 RepID=UPI0038166A41
MVDPLTIGDEDRRSLARWAGDCAERVLPLFEAAVADDARPREAIEGVRDFVRDGKRTARLRSLAWAALAAAREAGDPAATAAARAAGYAAAVPYLHPLVTPHQSRHVLAPAVYGARAREIAVGTGTGPGDEEIRWASGHVPPEVRALVRQLPARSPGRSRLDALYHALDAALRDS